MLMRFRSLSPEKQDRVMKLAEVLKANSGDRVNQKLAAREIAKEIGSADILLKYLIPAHG